MPIYSHSGILYLLHKTGKTAGIQLNKEEKFILIKTIAPSISTVSPSNYMLPGNIMFYIYTSTHVRRK
ncbi:hypothetical protein GCM10027189_03210 [Rufibacter soli]